MIVMVDTTSKKFEFKVQDGINFEQFCRQVVQNNGIIYDNTFYPVPQIVTMVEQKAVKK